MDSWHQWKPGVQPTGGDWPHPGSLCSLLGCIYPRQSLGNTMSSWPGVRSLPSEKGLAAACLPCSLPVVLAMTHTVHRCCGAPVPLQALPEPRAAYTLSFPTYKNPPPPLRPHIGPDTFPDPPSHATLLPPSISLVSLSHYLFNKYLPNVCVLLHCVPGPGNRGVDSTSQGAFHSTLC